MADPDECTEEMVDMCKDLWEKRLKECEENAEKWAGMCEPPRCRAADLLSADISAL